jgi:hypothetical protein
VDGPLLLQLDDEMVRFTCDKTNCTHFYLGSTRTRHC